jgi:hypothetical protein
MLPFHYSSSTQVTHSQMVYLLFFSLSFAKCHFTEYRSDECREAFNYSSAAHATHCSNYNFLSGIILSALQVTTLQNFFDRNLRIFVISKSVFSLANFSILA